MKSWNTIIKKIALTLVLVLAMPTADARRMRPNHPRPGKLNAAAAGASQQLSGNRPERPKKPAVQKIDLAAAWAAHKAGEKIFKQEWTRGFDYVKEQTTRAAMQQRIYINASRIHNPKAGFIIEANTTVVWDLDSKSRLNGAIVFTDETSQLFLAQDLYLGTKGKLVGGKSFSGDPHDAHPININGQGKTIYMAADLALPEYSSVVCFDLTIDGGSKTLDRKSKTLKAHNFYGFTGQESLTLKNMTFDFTLAKADYDIIPFFLDRRKVEAFFVVSGTLVENYIFRYRQNIPAAVFWQELNLDNVVVTSSDAIATLANYSDVATYNTVTLSDGGIVVGSSTMLKNNGILTNNGIVVSNVDNSYFGSFINNGVVGIQPGWSDYTNDALGFDAASNGVVLPLSRDGSIDPTVVTSGFIVAGNVLLDSDCSLTTGSKIIILPESRLYVTTGTNLAGYARLTNAGAMILPLGAKINGDPVVAGSLDTLRNSATYQAAGGYLVPDLDSINFLSRAGEKPLYRMDKPGSLDYNISQNGDFTPADCSDGFVIPDGTTLIWDDGDASTKVNGPIFFYDHSKITLNSDLCLGERGNFINWDDWGYFNINGQSHSIVLGGDVLLNQGEYSYVTLYSSLTIDGGAGQSTLRVGYFDGFCPYQEDDDEVPDLKLQNITFVLLQPEYFLRWKYGFVDLFRRFSYSIFAVPLTLNNVTVKSLNEWPQNLMDYGCPLTIQGAVNLTGTWLTLGSSYYAWSWDKPLEVFSTKLPEDFSITIAPHATLKCSAGIVEAANWDGNGDTTTITFADSTSTLQLNDCDFYTGGSGLTLDTGRLQYSGKVNIFVGDNEKETFVPGGLLTFDSSLTQIIDPHAVVTFAGQTKQIIDQRNAAYYLQHGFTIPANATYEWNCSPAQVVRGPIAGVDSQSSRLQLNTPMYLASQSLIGTGMAISGLGDNSLRVVVDRKNVTDFVEDFVVKSNTTVVWNRGLTPLAGTVTAADVTSRFELASDLYLAADAQMSMPFSANGKTVYSAKNKRVVVGINDANYATYKNGFTIPAGATYEWAATGPLLGPITFADWTSKLKLGGNLRLGEGGGFVGFVVTNDLLRKVFEIQGPEKDLSVICLEGNGKKIILETDYTFSGNGIAFDGDLTIDGQGHVLNLPVASFVDLSMGIKSLQERKFITPESTLTLKNMKLEIGSNDSKPFNRGLLFCFLKAATLDEVCVNVLEKTDDPSYIKTLISGPYCGSLNICNKVSFDGPGKKLTLGYSRDVMNVVIQKNAELYVGPGLIFEFVNSNLGNTPSLVMTDETSILHLDGCDFYTGGNGLNVTSGTVLFNNRVNLHTCNYGDTPDMQVNFLFGDGSNPVNLVYLNSATVTLDGLMIVDPSSGDAIIRNWSWLTYMQADNNFSAGYNDFTSGAINAMKDVGSNNNLNILVQRDMARSTGTERYKIVQGQMVDAGSLATEMGKNPKEELIDSMSWVKQKFPATNYVLMLWDHGNGVLDGVGGRARANNRGILYDDSQGTFVNNADLKDACAQIKANIGKNIGVVVMDACEMAMIEVAYQIKDSVDYLVASQQLSWSWASRGPAWAFGGALQELADNASNADMNPQALASNLASFCASFYETNVDSSNLEALLDNAPINTLYTMSAIDLSKVGDAVKIFQAVASQIAKIQQSGAEAKAEMNRVLEVARQASQKFYHRDDAGEPDYVDLVDFYYQLAVAVHGSSLPYDSKEKLVECIKKAQDVFAASGLIAANVAGSSYNGKANGLSLYLPKTTVKDSYMDTDFAKFGAPDWVKVLNNRK